MGNILRGLHHGNSKGKVLRVQILNSKSTTPSKKFIGQLYDQLEKYYVDTDVLGSIDDADPTTVSILVINKYPDTSIRSELEQCLKNIKCEDLVKRMLLIVLHVVREEKLPKLASDSDVYCINKNIGRVVDMGFNDEDIYPCDLNKKALKIIIEFIKGQRTSTSETKSEDDPKQATFLSEDSTLASKTKSDDHLKQGTELKEPSLAASEKQFKADNKRKNELNEQSTAASKTEAVHNSEKKLKKINSDTKKKMKLYRQKVYLISPSKSKAEESFVGMFQTELDKLGIKIEIRESSHADKLDPDQILILICNATSRIESDLQNAFDERTAKVANKTILIMLHVVREGKEPKMFTEKKLLDSNVWTKYHSLSNIIDIAFDNKNGLYKCNMNDNAFEHFKKLMPILNEQQ